MVDTAERSGVDRNDLAKKINSWEFSGINPPSSLSDPTYAFIPGFIQTKPSQVRAASHPVLFGLIRKLIALWTEVRSAE